LFNQSTIHDNMLCFSPNGNVGIGDNNPSHKLSVTGNINATDTITCETLVVRGGFAARDTNVTNLPSAFVTNTGTEYSLGNRRCFSFTGSGQTQYFGGNVGRSDVLPHIFYNCDNTLVVSVSHTGVVRGSAFTVVSDSRIKKDDL